MNFSPHVLVVDDDPIVIGIFQDMLSQASIQADYADSSEEALTRMMERPYDLVISDIVLPDMSGLELLRRIREISPGTAVILMTAFATMDNVLEALTLGVYDFLIKPFDSMDSILAKIRRAIEKLVLKGENQRLIEYLRQANHQIESMNRSLEEKVRERTEELRKLNEKLHELTITDDVTGLYNQRFLIPRVADEFTRAGRYKTALSIIMIDLDFFKQVNDTHDHIFGSRVLKRVGEIMLKVVRNTDLVGRYGGDEYVIVLPHTDLDNACRAALRIREALEGANVGDEEDIYSVTASFGVASILGCSAKSGEELLRAADRALYHSKENGRNRVSVAKDQKLIEFDGQ